jgi:hypothetical protein
MCIITRQMTQSDQHRLVPDLSQQPTTDHDTAFDTDSVERQTHQLIFNGVAVSDYAAGWSIRGFEARLG